jgi:hypothetical protein
MDEFLQQDKAVLEYYIRKYCPELPLEREYIEPKLKLILSNWAKTDPIELDGIFWPCFDDRYDRMFIDLIEKKSLVVQKCVMDIDTYYDVVAYPTPAGSHIGYLVQERDDNDEFIQKADIIMDDLYKSSLGMSSLEPTKHKKVLMNLMRFIDSTRDFVRKTWPKSASEELLQNLQDKYDSYDEQYDELAMLSL